MYKTFQNQKFNSFRYQSSSKIKLSLRFTTGLSCTVYAKKEETFQMILDKAINENKFYNIKDKIKGAIFEAKKIDFKKTISENDLKEGSIVLIVVGDLTFKKNALQKKTLSDSVSTTASLSDSIIDFDEFNEYILLYIYNKYVKRLQNSQKIFLARNSGVSPCSSGECTHIHTSKHHHGLVLLYSNRNWICDICRSEYSKNVSTYYCSICDFDVCSNCIGCGNDNKYSLNQFHHEQTGLKNYKFPCHEHQLIYCRTSRNKYHDTNWICELCFKNYENKIWSFYCTNCDYDICLSCSKKFIPREQFIRKIGIKIDDHCHNLVYMVTNRDWICNLCRESFPNIIPTFYCTKCDFDVCRRCMEELCDEIKYPLIFKGKRISKNIKTIHDRRHHHPLIYCITSRDSERSTNWICNECFKHYNNSEWSFYCSLCDYEFALIALKKLIIFF